jgi:hypothetical protein
LRKEDAAERRARVPIAKEPRSDARDPVTAREEPGPLREDRAIARRKTGSEPKDPGPWAQAGPIDLREPFCIRDGGFLPSEAEWEYAAAGGSQQREYPWGSAAPGTTSQYAIYGCYYGASDAGACSILSDVAPVGTPPLGAGRWGQLDLAGNMWQWNLDWFAAYANPSVDGADLTATSSRVIRGGDAANPSLSLLFPPYRGGFTPSHRGDENGLRCARSP